MRQKRKWFLAAALSVMAMLFTSCTNLEAVHEWSKTSLEATLYNEIITTYADTPRRLKTYDPSDMYDAQIELRKKQASALRQILSVVSDYMSALSILSADSTIDYDKDVDALTSSIENLDAGISTETLGAVGSLMKTVTSAAAKVYQARQVSILIDQSNEPLQKILTGELRRIVASDFQRDLEIEKLWVDRYYDQHLQSGTPSAAAVLALGEWKTLRLQQNLKRLKAVDAYLVILDKVAKGHQELYDNRNKLDSIYLIKELYSLVKDIRKQIKILVEA